MLQILGTIGGIILADLVLSGDNALVIGAAAAGLPRRQRIMAIASGGAAAVALRITFTIIAALLLQLPLLQAIGGLVLIAIAIKLLADRETAEGESEKPGAPPVERELEVVSAPHPRGFIAALFTIMIADVTMSLDNVLAVAALAGENIPLLIAGLVASILILMTGSALVAELISRLPWILDLAALVLAWTAANMVLHDLRLGPILEGYDWAPFAVPVVAIAIVVIADIFLRLREHANHPALKG